MAKDKRRGKTYFSEDGSEIISNLTTQDISNLREIDKLLDVLPLEERMKFQNMFSMAMTGVTPEEYEKFYRLFELSMQMSEKILPKPDKSEENNHVFRILKAEDKYERLPNASEKTLVLKIQMKDVNKPPMWREVEMPADYVFAQLHEIIQEIMGLYDCHLWRFGYKAYGDSLAIGLQGDDWGLDEVTHEADDTEVTQFLQKKGDKLEYVYDFGDDWIFTIEVKELLDKQIDYPVCTKYKCDLNAIEDFGGVWSYLSAREDYVEWNKLSKKERIQRAAAHGFDSPEEYIELLNESRIDLDSVNEALNFI